jgi:orotidine-5'-phosphate decarboxylase
MTLVTDKIIVALDVATQDEALSLVHQLSSRISRFKIGLQLYTAEGPAIVRKIVATGARVFLDLKLHDIPNTVAGAVESAKTLGVEMLTIHLSGGEPMIRAALEAAEDQLILVGVTVLTSQTNDTLGAIGCSDGVEDQVLRLAKLGVGCGIRALVASPREAAILRAEFGDQVKIITPGIRPAGTTIGDQKRITTPRDAIQAGADFLVIGRPIVADPDPLAAAEKIIAELSSR